MKLFSSVVLLVVCDRSVNRVSKVLVQISGRGIRANTIFILGESVNYVGAVAECCAYVSEVPVGGYCTE